LGMRVFACCYTDAGAKKLKAEASSNLTTLPLDVTKSDSIAGAVEIVRKQCPEGIWGLINNAGIVEVSPADCCVMSSYRRVMDVNFFGVIESASGFMPLIKRQKGRVVNVASIAGFLAPPGFGPYSGSKFAVEAYSDALRRELLPFEVDVVVIEPSFMATPLLDMERNSQLQERSWATLPESYREEYGEQWILGQREEMKHAFGTASSPEMVVDYMEDALLNKYVPQRYTMGSLVWLFKLMKYCPHFADAAIGLSQFRNVPKAVAEARAGRKSRRSAPLPVAQAVAPATEEVAGAKQGSGKAAKKSSKKKK